MARPLRLLESGAVYHVISRGNNRCIIFLDAQDKQIYLGLLAEESRRASVAIYHYVLMDNHVHLLMKCGEPGLFSDMMKRVSLRYAIHHARRYGRSGHLWESRYKSYVVTEDSYLMTCAAYIELNPVRAGMVAHPGDHRWSSYRHYASGEVDPIVEENVTYTTLGGDRNERMRAYRDIVAGWMQISPTGSGPAWK